MPSAFDVVIVRFYNVYTAYKPLQTKSLKKQRAAGVSKGTVQRHNNQSLTKSSFLLAAIALPLASHPFGYILIYPNQWYRFFNLNFSYTDCTSIAMGGNNYYPPQYLSDDTRMFISALLQSMGFPDRLVIMTLTMYWEVCEQKTSLPVGLNVRG